MRSTFSKRRALDGSGKFLPVRLATKPLGFTLTLQHVVEGAAHTATKGLTPSGLGCAVTRAVGPLADIGLSIGFIQRDGYFEKYSVPAATRRIVEANDISFNEKATAEQRAEAYAILTSAVGQEFFLNVPAPRQRVPGRHMPTGNGISKPNTARRVNSLVRNHTGLRRGQSPAPAPVVPAHLARPSKFQTG